MCPHLISSTSTVNMHCEKLRTLEVLGIVIGGHNTNSIRYADDTALIAESEEKLQQFPSSVLRKVSQSINTKKTECRPMVISCKKIDPKCVIFIRMGKSNREISLIALVVLYLRTENMTEK